MQEIQQLPMSGRFAVDGITCFGHAAALNNSQDVRGEKMKLIKFALASLMAAVVVPALAQSDPRIAITVDRAVGSEAVSFSRPGTTRRNSLPLETYAAFEVKITNGATNQLNRVFFNGTGVANQSGQPVFDSFIANRAGDSCSSSGVGSPSFSCSLASLPPGTDTSFTIIFKTPTQSASGPVTLDVNWTGGGFEGNGGGNGCCSQSGASAQKVDLIDPTTNPIFLTQASTFMRPKGFQLFTGPQAVPSSTYGWATIVTAPAFTASTYTKASIVQENPATSCAPYAVGQGCYASNVSIPNLTPFASSLDPTKVLQITIRWDKAFFSLGRTPASDVKLYYTPDATTLNPSPVKIELQLCSTTNLPISGRPCLNGAPKILRNSDTSDKDLWGDLEFNVLAVENGRYEN
jgi:hypothetical protein